MHVSISVYDISLFGLQKILTFLAPKTHRATNLCDTINAKAHIKVPWATEKKTLGKLFEHLWSQR